MLGEAASSVRVFCAGIRRARRLAERLPAVDLSHVDLASKGSAGYNLMHSVAISACSRLVRVADREVGAVHSVPLQAWESGNATSAQVSLDHIRKKIRTVGPVVLLHTPLRSTASAGCLASTPP